MVFRTYKKGKMICENDVGSEQHVKGKVVRLLEMKNLSVIPIKLKEEFDVYKQYLISCKGNKLVKEPIKESEPVIENLSEPIVEFETNNECLNEKVMKMIDINTHLHSEVDYTGYSHRKRRPIRPTPITPSTFNNIIKKPKFMNLTTAFNINKITPESIITKNEDLRFQPLILSNHITLKSYKSNRISANIKKPIKLTFIKFHDQIKPPTFCVYKKSNQRITYKKIDFITNYDVDSDENWIYEDGESIDSEDSVSEEEVSEDNEWIDKEGAVVTSMKYKKPEILHENIVIEYFKVFDESYMEIQLKRESKFDEGLEDSLKERLKCGRNREDICRNFAAEHNIIVGVVRQKSKEFKEQINEK